MNTKEKIINVSIDLFSRQGYKGVSIRDITKIVGIRESSLYKHFKSKEELLIPIFEIFLEANNQSNLSGEELIKVIENRDLLEFLKGAMHSFFEDLENETLEKIYRILMAEQFRLEKARNLIRNELVIKPTLFYSHIFKIKLEDRFHDYNLLAREYYYPLFTMAYEYALIKYENQDTSVIRNQIMQHIDFFYEKILTPKKQ